jgi:hypothetical protein
MTRTHLLSIGFAACLTTWVAAADTPQVPGPEKEHAWLKQFVGTWETASECSLGPGQEPLKCQGTMSARMLGDLWVVVESESSMMGTKVNALQTLGFDPKKKKYIGTWVDSMLNHMWQYEGELDDAGTKLTLEAEGPNFLEEGKTAKFRDIYEFKSPDQVSITSQMQGADGAWAAFMSGSATRTKAAQ